MFYLYVLLGVWMILFIVSAGFIAWMEAEDAGAVDWLTERIWGRVLVMLLILPTVLTLAIFTLVELVGCWVFFALRIHTSEQWAGWREDLTIQLRSFTDFIVYDLRNLLMEGKMD